MKTTSTLHQFLLSLVLLVVVIIGIAAVPKASRSADSLVRESQPAQPHADKAVRAPVLIGRITLAAGVGEVRHPSIHAGMICIFSVNSPDSLSEGARVSVYGMDEGVLTFWAHTFDSEGSFPTTDEPEVHFSVWAASGPGTYP